MIEAGIRGVLERTVEEKHTAKTVGSGELEVLATPVMIAWMEETAWKSLRDYLDPGWSTVGSRIEISHLSPTPVGMKVRCETEVTLVDRRRVVFRVEVFDAAGKIGEGIHERFAVQADRFLQKAGEKAAAPVGKDAAGPGEKR